MRSRFFAIFIALEVLILVFLIISGRFAADDFAPVRNCNRKLVQAFQLTDLSVWTGARYTRHLSQADVFSAFQDGAGALERFPEGALAPLPSTIAPREKDDEPAYQNTRICTVDSSSP